MPLPSGGFTLAWTHSIEKTVCEEDYLVAGGWLLLQQARVRGTDAGMDIPAGALLIDGVYRYRPSERWHRELRLTRSGFVPDYRLCLGARCRPMTDWVALDNGVTRVRDCTASPSVPQ